MFYIKGKNVKASRCKVKVSSMHLIFDIFWQSTIWTCNKRKLYESSDCWSRDMPNFDFLVQGLRLASLSHCLYHFLWKIFLMLYSINWKNFIIRFPLLLGILSNKCTVVIIFFSIWVFFRNHSQITGFQGKGEGIPLTPHYHFHPLHSD